MMAAPRQMIHKDAGSVVCQSPAQRADVGSILGARACPRRLPFQGPGAWLAGAPSAG
jgi:hypothetical protein